MMSDSEKQDIRFTLIPIIEITDEESRSFWSRSATQIEQPIITQDKSLVSTSQTFKLYPYTPPDTLMFPLFSAIQRKAWIQAKKLCHELVLCDPERRIYQDLYVRLDQITNLIDQRLHPRSFFSETSSSNSVSGRSSQQ